MKKINKYRIIPVIIGLTIFNSSLTACEKSGEYSEQKDSGNSQEPNQENPQSNLLFTHLQGLPVEPVSKEERDGLIYLREEEKLARDVYLYFQESFSLPVFINIPKSEQQHMDAVKFLLDRYNIDDPAEGLKNGIFTNTELQKLYNDLISSGKDSQIEALKVGALIEEVDIRDLLDELNNHVDNQDIKFVYENLIRGSKNHLRAFTRMLGMNGIEYLPQIIDEKYYHEIID